jgi:uncharacterized protein (TIGR02246 family)
MTGIRGVLICAALLVAPASGWAGPAEEASAAIDRWAAAFSANDVEGVAKSYSEDAIVISVYSPTIDYGKNAIRHHFLSRLAGSGNKVVIGERRMTVLGENAVLATGLSDFTVVQGGKAQKVPARFSFVVTKRGSDWLIAHQHSSIRAEVGH